MIAELTLTYRLGKTVDTIPMVEGALIQTPLHSVRDGHRFRVAFLGVAMTSGADVGCDRFVVSTDVALDTLDVPEQDLDGVCALAGEVASHVADSIWTSQPNKGFAGGQPDLETATLQAGGVTRSLVLAGHRAMAPMVVGWTPPTLADLQQVLTSGEGPDTAQILLAQASHYAMGHPSASKGAAVTLAALACEVRIKTMLLGRAPAEHRADLESDIPIGRQSKPMPDLVKKWFPRVFDRSLVELDHDLYQRYLKLLTARNDFAHGGEQIPENDAWRHVGTARMLLAWLSEC